MYCVLKRARREEERRQKMSDERGVLETGAFGLYAAGTVPSLVKSEAAR
jgi:hypothetical protein